MSIFKFAHQNPTKITHRPKLGEELLQSAGYTHLLQIGSANDLPSLSKSPIWRKVSEFNLSIGTISNYLSPKANRTATTEQEIDPINLNDPTHLSYFGLQQLLSGRIPQNLEALKNTLTSLTKPLDDRKLLLEDIVGLLATSARQPLHGPRPSVNVLQGQFINLLWNDLPHPPPTDLSPQHRYRSADGSNNNLMGFPQLGAAGQAYSRSVKPLHQIPPDIAEPEELFDAILRRDYDRDGFKEHPAGLSSLMFAFANLIIHDLFWSNNRSSDNPQFQNNSQKDHINSSKSSSWQNLTSSYVSLDTLYGVNSTQQATVRDNLAENLGRGLLYNDTFASARLLLMPPASSALLILFSRNHNRIARKVLQLNERNQWQPDLSKLTQDERQQQDDEIFGTARLVNCAHFAGIVLSDYILAILNTIQADSDWILDPRMTIKNLLGSTPQAVGNSVSVEFNILYRWHSTISKSQEKWIENKIAKGLESRDWDKLDQAAFIKAMSELKKELNADGTAPKDWKISTFEPISSTNPEGFHQAQVYERDPQTGKFRDEDIAKLLKDSTHEVAGAFGARGVPAVLKWVDCQGMRTARDVWRVCTLNELRTSLGLKVFETFEEWNSNPEIASAMEELVGHPSNIPLYVGLHGEEAKEPRLGAGLCPGFTISRAILSDAVSLVRGDRFFTDSATADGMTDWGLSDCQVDVREGSYGGLLQRLISYNLPNQYRYNDVALLFPFMVPEKIYQILMDISPVKACNYSLKSLPAKSLGFTHHQASDGRVLIKEISDTESVQIERIEELFGIQNSRSNISTVFDSLFTIVHGNEWKTFEKFISERILQCAVQRSSRTNDLTVDICRDVINPLITGWLAHMFGLVETGLHSQHLLLTALSDVYLYLTEPEMTYKGRTAARIAASGLAWQIKYHIEAAIAPTSFKKLFKKGAAILTVGALNALEDTIKFASGQPVLQHVHQDCCRFYSILVTQNARENKLTSDELAADCFRAVATLAYSLTHGAAHALDHLIPSSNSTSGLESSASTHLVQSLENLNISFKEDKSKFEQVAFRANYSRHGLEATRINHWDPKLQGFINEMNTKDKREGRTIGIIDNKWDLSRDYKEYFKMLDSNGNCLRFYEEVIGVIVKEVTSLPNVRKSPGLQGTLTKVHILDSVSGMPTMHIRFNKDQSSTET